MNRYSFESSITNYIIDEQYTIVINEYVSSELKVEKRTVYKLYRNFFQSFTKQDELLTITFHILILLICSIIS